mgnify:CR=1 FL=1
MKTSLFTLFLLFAIHDTKAQTTHVLDSTTVTSREVIDSLDIPWEIIWGPDNYIWCTERFGRVSRINPTTGQHHVLLDLSSSVYEQSEAGMLGMALHPDFANYPHVFIAYTYLSGSNIRERVVRFNYTGTSLVAADTLVENIIGNTTHIGCRLIILPDTTMLMSTGDAQNQTLPQNKSSLVGKILRMNLDGSIPSDNPNPSSLVWSYGHRNAQGMWLAPNGHIYSSEHGPTTDDELNILKADKNYGWPNVHGFCNTPPEIAFCGANAVEEPLVAYTPTIAPADIIWYSHPAIPEFKDKLLMAVLKDKSLIVYTFNSAGDSVIAQNKYFKNTFGRLRDVCVSPSGKVYLATSGLTWSNSNTFSHKIIELSNNAYIPSSTNELTKPSFEVKVYPNPISQGQTVTVWLAKAEHGKFELYDISGQLILSKQIFGTEKIELNATEGIYVYGLTNSNGIQATGKMVVN